MGEKFLYIDDSGQLSNNGRHEYFLYGCLFVESQKVIEEINNKINAFCKTRHIKGELKGNYLKIKDRKKLLTILSDIDGAHQFFVIVKNSELTRLNFHNPINVKRYKQFAIRRIIEKILKKQYINKEDSVNIKIDNEAFNSKEGLQNFIEYLNSFWSKPGTFMFQQMYWDFIPSIQSRFTIKYLDSKHDRLIQVADLIANTKYRRFRGNEKCCSEYLKEESCLKLPDDSYFHSPKSPFYIER
ncbi:TPA: DUF3800 domain-containing protein [Staphylococcus aureus]|uniref:DUF3800 domain-containing protein n=1 Tax=Staphylococcus sp. EG-SA-15 TaxID=2767492 RepID=UPI00197E4F96|nr:DUF3800 domain-containing protein [Staphylococcus sp. EG-SA-15]EJX3503355.1 DUF3800 domain-containing protein [Staphylococcus aureus]MBN4895265.1 DUF3800 domain-containing protein [Staphylococcus sp. EG-SA-15]HDF8212608.1 DUF3800 domain-containing protein [Staphylococcus aureus]HEH2093167.1 DUF3800 domain-containing protein [Staphylococcus aureus]HEH3758371.1 DUF3800 domain-containing protein [Staphylococcus aureus]